MFFAFKNFAYIWSASDRSSDHCSSAYRFSKAAGSSLLRGLKMVRFCTTLKALGVNIFRAAALRLSQMMPEEGLCEA